MNENYNFNFELINEIIIFNVVANYNNFENEQ